MVCSDQKHDIRTQAELVVEAEEQERQERDRGDGRVLPAQIGGCAFLNSLGDLSHALVAVRAAEQPDGQPHAVADGDAGADERKQHRVVVEEAPDDQRSYPLTKSAPSDLGAANFLSHGAPWSAVSASDAALGGPQPSALTASAYASWRFAVTCLKSRTSSSPAGPSSTGRSARRASIARRAWSRSRSASERRRYPSDET